MTWTGSMVVLATALCCVPLIGAVGGDYHGYNHEWNTQADHFGSEAVEGIVFVMLAAVFITIGAVALGIRRRLRDREMTQKSSTPSSSKDSRTREDLKLDYVESAFTPSPSPPDSPVSHVPVESIVPEHENTTVVERTSDNSRVSKTTEDSAGFVCTFLEGADSLVDGEEASFKDELNTEAYMALKQWRPPRVKPRLSEESRRRISAMSLGVAKHKRNNGDAPISVL